MADRGKQTFTRWNLEENMDNMEFYVMKFRSEKMIRRAGYDLLNGNNRDSILLKMMDEAIMGVEKNLFELSLQKGTIIYRAREIPVSDYSCEKGLQVDDNLKTTGYDAVNSLEAPLGIPKAGRNNITGVSYFYTSKDQETACAEIKSRLRTLVSLAELEVQQELRLVDFSEDKKLNKPIEDMCLMPMVMTYIMDQFSRPEYCEEDYRISQIIADYIRRTGVDGIATRSAFTNGTNYTIFNSGGNRITMRESRILVHYASNECFWDFNGQKEFFTNSEDCSYKKHIGEEGLHKLKGIIERNN